MKELGRKLSVRHGKEAEPRVLIFCCSWGFPIIGSPVTASNGNTRTIRTVCSGKIDPSFILKAFDSGIDGVMLAACPPGNCHFMDGNYQAMRRFMLLQNTLQQLGIEPERLQLEWVAPGDGTKLQSKVGEFVEKIARLGTIN